MSRYIDAERLIDDIRPFAEYDSNRSNKDWVRRFEIAIEAQPTADVVPMDFYDRCMEIEIQKRMNMVKVVRCKDCKWKHGSECVRFADVRPFADDYCSRAERRTDDDNGTD